MKRFCNLGETIADLGAGVEKDGVCYTVEGTAEELLDFLGTLHLTDEEFNKLCTLIAQYRGTCERCTLISCANATPERFLDWMDDASLPYFDDEQQA